MLLHIFDSKGVTPKILRCKGLGEFTLSVSGLNAKGCRDRIRQPFYLLTTLIVSGGP